MGRPTLTAPAGFFVLGSRPHTEGEREENPVGLARRADTRFVARQHGIALQQRVVTLLGGSAAECVVRPLILPVPNLPKSAYRPVCSDLFRLAFPLPIASRCPKALSSMMEP